MASTFNFNIGILGHVDSGKTSLAKALSTTASTAAFDKNPQSVERGITLDLGFSSLVIDCPHDSRQQEQLINYDKLQFTFVDCPGHASLIRTVIAGASIIDLVLLVVDVTKGIQTQTAECLILGEITCPAHMIVVLNKIDLISPEKRPATIEKMTKRLKKTLESTSFKDAKIVAVSSASGESEIQTNSLNELIEELKNHVYVPNRSNTGKFLFAVDHCFAIRGQGTVMTGTVLKGEIKLNESIELPSLKELKKVKSMQAFRKPIQSARQGDRVGICVTQFDAKLFERGLVCAPGALKICYAAILTVNPISYYKQSLLNKSKFHVSIGHETVMSKATFFGCPADSECRCNAYGSNNVESVAFAFDQDYAFQEGFVQPKSVDNVPKHQYVLLEFEQPILCYDHCLYIASKLDTDIHANVCRLAFHGMLIHAFHDKQYLKVGLPELKVYKLKSRTGMVERMADEYTVIVAGFIKKETSFELFQNLKVRFSTGEHGVVESSFGQSGKVKVRCPSGFRDETRDILATLVKKKTRGKTEPSDAGDKAKIEIEVILEFKRYVYDPAKKMVQ